MATDAGCEGAVQAVPSGRTPLAMPPARPTAGPMLPPKLLIGGGLLIVAIGYLMITSLQQSAVYYLTVGELVGRGSGSAGQAVRLAGAVVDGSIQRDRTHLRFELTDGTASVPVVHTGTIPDLFGYRAEGAYQDVVVEGRYGSSGVFEARNIIVKHGPAFEADETPPR
jgi:cytochrome c-type biogenesis protein CcmE